MKKLIKLILVNITAILLIQIISNDFIILSNSKQDDEEINMKSSLMKYLNENELHCNNVKYRYVYPLIDAELYVWASNLNLREKPGFDGKIITKIPFGSKVKHLLCRRIESNKAIVDIYIQDTFTIKENKPFYRTYLNRAFFDLNTIRFIGKSITETQIIESSKFQLEDFWMQIQYKGQVGYAFGGYLSRLNPSIPENTDQNSIQKYMEELILNSEGNLRIDSLQRSYTEGLIYASFNDGDIEYQSRGMRHIEIDETLILKGYSFAEVFLIARYIFGISALEMEKDGDLTFKSRYNRGYKIKIEQNHCRYIITQNK